MKTGEILFTVLIFVIGFVGADYLATRIMVPGPTVRLVVRLAVLGQLIGMLYLFFDGRDTARRLVRIEEALTIAADGDEPVAEHESTAASDKTESTGPEHDATGD